MVKDHRDLMVWQKAVDLAVEINYLIKKLPKEELYALSNQMRRAAVSIPSNIAEGRARSSSKDFIRFLYMARGSLYELDTQILIAVKSGYLMDSDIELAMSLYDEVKKMLNSMISKMINN